MSTSALQRSGMKVELTESAMLAEARIRSGLGNMREAGLGNRLQRVMTYLDQLDFDAKSRRAAFDLICDLVVSRAKMLEDRERYPEIGEEAIERPIIVTGLPRSGTTIMHALLAADPANRAPRYWEVIRPSPPPGISSDDDPRIKIANDEVSEMCRKQPMMLKVHPFYDELANHLMECEPFGMLDLHILWIPYFFRLPTILSIDLMDDPVAYYRFNRMLLQNLQWKRPARRWALKGTEHHVRLDALKQVYPESIVIWIHRDPLKVAASLMESMAYWFEGCIGKPLSDRPAIGRQVLAMYKGMLDKALASPVVDHPDVCHVLFADFAVDPVGTIEKIYKRYGLPFDDSTAAAMRAWNDHPDNRGNRHGRFEYSLANFNMTPDEVESEMAGYRARFGIPREK